MPGTTKNPQVWKKFLTLIRQSLTNTYVMCDVAVSGLQSMGCVLLMKIRRLGSLKIVSVRYGHFLEFTTVTVRIWLLRQSFITCLHKTQLSIILIFWNWCANRNSIACWCNTGLSPNRLAHCSSHLIHHLALSLCVLRRQQKQAIYSKLKHQTDTINILSQ